LYNYTNARVDVFMEMYIYIVTSELLGHAVFWLHANDLEEHAASIFSPEDGAVFWLYTNISEKHAASVFRVEDRGSIFLNNAVIQPKHYRSEEDYLR
jgi:hypothetical protein